VVSLGPIFRAKILTKSGCSRRASARQAVRIFPNCGMGCAYVYDDEKGLMVSLWVVKLEMPMQNA
jgi:hypothetical protein